MDIKQRLAKEKGIDLNLTREVYLPVPDGEFLTGKSEFPDYLKKVVEERLAPIKDGVEVTYWITWMNSHLNNGLDYTYDEPESPYVKITAMDEKTVQEAARLVRQITKEEVIEKWAEMNE